MRDQCCGTLREAAIATSVPNVESGAASQGTVSERVARNLRDLREQRRYTVRTLSARLGELGHPIAPSGITKIEQGHRRVDVDDLVALALALGVSPNRLLLVPDVSSAEGVQLAPGVAASPAEAWRWATGERPLPTPGVFDMTAEVDFPRLNRPHQPQPPTHAEVAEHEAAGRLDGIADDYRRARKAGVPHSVLAAYLDGLGLWQHIGESARRNQTERED